MLTIGKAIPVNNFSFAGGDGFYEKLGKEFGKKVRKLW